MIESATVREANGNDLEEIVRLDRESGLAPWSLEDYMSLHLRVDTDVRLALDSEGVAVGVLINRFAGPEAELIRIFVGRGKRGQGVGQALMSAAAERLSAAGCREWHLEVRPSNQAAISLYRKNGFVETGRRRHYYRNPEEDALLMKATLPQR